jgi:tetratricopeptide (TPR) repeat protein
MRQSSTFLLGVASLLVGFTALSLLFPNRTDSQTQVVDKRVLRGIQYALRKEFRMAEGLFEEVLTQDPESAVAYNNLANTYILDYRYGSAILKYLKAVQHDPQDTNIFLNLGVVYYLQMELTKNEVYAGNGKREKPKEDWQKLSDEAFDKAFEKLQSAADACLSLKIPVKEDPKYNWVQKRLQEAAQRKGKASELKPASTTAKNPRVIPVYWKTK